MNAILNLMEDEADLEKKEALWKWSCCVQVKREQDDSQAAEHTRSCTLRPELVERELDAEIAGIRRFRTTSAFFEVVAENAYSLDVYMDNFPEILKDDYREKLVSECDYTSVDIRRMDSDVRRWASVRGIVEEETRQRVADLMAFVEYKVFLGLKSIYLGE